MKKLMLALALVGMSGVAMAQTEELPTLKHSVVTNGFGSNWFVAVGGAYNVFYSSQETGLSTNPFDSRRRNWGAELTIGKWFSPVIGTRLKVDGIWATQVNNVYGGVDAVTGLPVPQDGVWGVCPTVKQWEVSIQTMLNLNNLFCGYKERVWNISPCLGVGVGHHMASGGCYSPLFQIGFNNQFNMTKRLFVNLDIYYQFASAPYDGNENTIGSNRVFSPRDNKLAAALSLGCKLGKTGWDKAPDLAAITALNAAQLAALNDQLSELENENVTLKAKLAVPVQTNEVVRTVREVTATPVSVFFRINSSRIASKKDLVNVQALVDAAKENGNKIVVTGYADSKTGSASYNQTLSEKRANAVADALVGMGVDRANIEVKGLGGVDQLSPFSYNRRVIVELK